MASDNAAKTKQKTTGNGDGTNASLTLQVGNSNKATTKQSIADPLNSGLNGSLIAQIGNNNKAKVQSERHRPSGDDRREPAIHGAGRQQQQRNDDADRERERHQHVGDGAVRIAQHGGRYAALS